MKLGESFLCEAAPLPHTPPGQDEDTDRYYNYGRVCALFGEYFGVDNDTCFQQGPYFPVFLPPKNKTNPEQPTKLSVHDVMRGLRNHYQDTKNDP
jgi:hypothetical protein